MAGRSYLGSAGFPWTCNDVSHFRSKKLSDVILDCRVPANIKYSIDPSHDCDNFSFLVVLDGKTDKLVDWI